MYKSIYLIDERSRINSVSNITKVDILFKVINNEGGSLSTPIGRIEIKQMPSSEGVNPHSELRVVIRNDIRFKWGALKILKNQKSLNSINKIIPQKELEKLILELIEKEKITEPYSIYRTLEHIESFKTFGDFYQFD